MASNDISPIDIAATLHDTHGRPNTLTADQATLYSQAVRLGWGSSGLASWTGQRALVQFHDAIRLVDAARVLREAKDEERANDLYRRAGDLLEWLSRSSSDSEVAGQPAPLALLAAACYQLAGLPAMASGLLAQDQLPRFTGPLLAAFFRADFNAVLKGVTDYWRVELARSTEFSGEQNGKGRVAARVTASDIVRCLGLFAHSIRRDDRSRMNAAIRRLDFLARQTLRTSSEQTWLVFSLTADMARRYSDDSLWQAVEHLVDSLPAALRRRYSRFVQSLFQAGRGLVWPSQREGIRHLAGGKSFAMCTPTGSGKTAIAELAILQSIYREVVPGAEVLADTEPLPPLVLYLVPSRALASEVEARLERDLGRLDPNLVITGLYGGAEWSLASRWLTANAPTVLISTVEMAESMLRYFGPLFVARLTAVIVDEAHQIQFDKSDLSLQNLRRGENRAARLEHFAARLFSAAPACRTIALSAVAGGAEAAIAKWISGKDDSVPVGTGYRSTRQLIGALECRADGASLIRLELMNGSPLQLADRNAEAYVPLPFPRMPRTTGRLRDLGGFVQCHCLWAALQLAASGKIVLISVTSDLDSLLDHLHEALAEQKAWRGKTPKYFTVPDGPLGKLYEDCLQACRDYCGEGSFEAFFLALGIAVHHGQLPVRVRRLMTEVIRRGITPIAIATSTLTEGVNMPFDVVLVPRIIRKQKVSAPVSPEREYEWHVIGAGEFTNLAGRAGRPGTGVEGITLVLQAPEPTAGRGTKTYKHQEKTVALERIRFRELLSSIRLAPTQANPAVSPLATLLDLLYDAWTRLVSRENLDEFLSWLESAAPGAIVVPQATQAAMEAADALDSLDLILLSAIEEAEQLSSAPLAGSELERRMTLLWSRTYARFATSDSARLERMFVARGRGISQSVYPERPLRRQLYRLGLPPHRGKKFLSTAARIEELLREASGFGGWTSQQRYDFVEDVAICSQEDETFQMNFVRSISWQTVLRWWLRAPDAKKPGAREVRDWLRLATNGFEYRVGTAVGATIADIWNRLSPEAVIVPTLDEWREKTGLPWSAMWLRELLAWGTLEPVTAFLMGTPKVSSRKGAEQLTDEYYRWYSSHYADDEPDARLHPARIAEWYAERFSDQGAPTRAPVTAMSVKLLRDFAHAASDVFSVLPVATGTSVTWIDAAGYALAESLPVGESLGGAPSDVEYILNVREKMVTVSPQED